MSKVSIVSVNAMAPLPKVYSPTKVLNAHARLWADKSVRNVYCNHMRHNEAFVVVHRRNATDRAIVSKVRDLVGNVA